MPLFLAVQWHPENLSGQPEHLAPFKLLVERARKGRLSENAAGHPRQVAAVIQCGSERPAMPLRDHFRPPVTDRAFWEALHGAWPVTIVYDLNKRLPGRYTASPRVHLGTSFEIDVAATDLYASSVQSTGAADSNGGVATAVWAPRNRR